MKHIFWAGDSTVKTNKADTFPQTGIGQAFDRYTKPGVAIVNHAENGRSTKSFIDESRLAAIYNDITEGDYLFIQFGHNDEKVYDPSRYTDPHGEYKVNLGKFVNVARNKKAYPVFITSVERRLFDEEGKLLPSEHVEYALGMKEAGKELDVPVIDLFTMSREYLAAMGDEETYDLYMNLKPGEAKWCPHGQADDSHLKYEGAMIYAGFVAKGLKEIGGHYAELVI